jgi:hypothetical protein
MMSSSEQISLGAGPSSPDGCMQTFVNTVSHACHSTQNFIEEHTSRLYAQTEKIRDVACKILASIVGGLLFVSQSSMFVFGILVAVINPAIMKESIDRITSAWNSQSKWSQCLIVAAGAVASSISLAASAFFFGGSLCLSWQEHPQEPSSPILE